MNEKVDRNFNQVMANIDEMYRFALSEGKEIPPDTAELIAHFYTQTSSDPKSDEPANPKRIYAVANILHSRLCALVAPATPLSLRTTSQEGWLTVPLRQIVTWMVGVAVLIVVIGLLLTGTVGRPSDAMLNHGQTLACAWLGSAFYTLFTMHEYLKNRTFDPKYQGVYVLRFFLGLVAGFLLAQLTQSLAGATETQQTAGGSGGNFRRELREWGPTALAIIGGFSADAVYQILQRIAETLVTLVKGTGEATAKAQSEIIEQKGITISLLTDYYTQAASRGASEEVLNKLRSVIDSLNKPKP